MSRDKKVSVPYEKICHANMNVTRQKGYSLSTRKYVQVILYPLGLRFDKVVMAYLALIHLIRWFSI